MLISSTIATTLLLFTGGIAASDFLPTWLAWWTGDAMGVLVAPLVLALVKLPWRRHVDSVKLTEIVVLLAGSFLVLLTESVFGILFLTFPLIVWVAWRFQLAGAAPLGLLASGVAITSAVRGTGVFAGHSLAERRVILQLFNGSIALVALLLSVAIVQRQRSRAELERTKVHRRDVRLLDASVSRAALTNLCHRAHSRDFGQSNARGERGNANQLHHRRISAPIRGLSNGMRARWTLISKYRTRLLDAPETRPLQEVPLNAYGIRR
jgi:hypothetical protein